MDIQIIRSNRKTLALEITADAKLRVRAPYQTTDLFIEHFIREKQDWIDTHLQAARQKQQSRPLAPALSPEQIRLLADQASSYIPERVSFYAVRMGVTYGRITIRNQKTRWGSCSSKGNLNFNCLLMLAPPDVIDYVVVHELCHRKEMNHSARFWTEVGQILPDYKKQRKWLRDHGQELMGGQI